MESSDDEDDWCPKTQVGLQDSCFIETDLVDNNPTSLHAGPHQRALPRQIALDQ